MHKIYIKTKKTKEKKKKQSSQSLNPSTMTTEKMVFTECLQDSQISFLTPTNNVKWYPI